MKSDLKQPPICKQCKAYLAKGINGTTIHLYCPKCLKVYDSEEIRIATPEGIIIKTNDQTFVYK